MRHRAVAVVFGCLLSVCVTSSRSELTAASQQRPEPDVSLSEYTAFLDTHCVGCHNQQALTGGLSLEGMDLGRIPADAELWEKVIRKVGGRMMPPPGMRSPDGAAADGFTSFLKASLDSAAAADPRPGQKALHRINRAEYGNAIRDLLNFEVDAGELLPPDVDAFGFDNMADVLGISPSLMERYLSAAWNIASQAIGDTTVTPRVSTFRVRSDLSQHDHIEGLPVGTRGGMLVEHNFPVDGEYVIQPKLWRNTVAVIRGLEQEHEDLSSNLGSCAGDFLCSYMSTVSWRTPTQPLPMEINPRVVFERMFGGDAATREARLARLEQNRSILDGVVASVRNLRRDLGARDQAKLDEYLENVREIERRLVQGERQRDASNLEAPPPPIGVPEDFEEHIALLFELQALAFQGDLTRVTTFMVSRSLSTQSYPQLGIADGHHPISHNNYVPEQIAKKAKVDTYHVQLFANFLERLGVCLVSSRWPSPRALMRWCVA